MFDSLPNSYRGLQIVMSLEHAIVVLRTALVRRERRRVLLVEPRVSRRWTPVERLLTNFRTPSAPVHGAGASEHSTTVVTSRRAVHHLRRDSCIVQHLLGGRTHRWHRPVIRAPDRNRRRNNRLVRRLGFLNFFITLFW